jgi:hypothetical protein
MEFPMHPGSRQGPKNDMTGHPLQVNPAMKLPNDEILDTHSVPPPDMHRQKMDVPFCLYTELVGVQDL